MVANNRFAAWSSSRYQRISKVLDEVLELVPPGGVVRAVRGLGEGGGRRNGPGNESEDENPVVRAHRFTISFLEVAGRR